MSRVAPASLRGDAAARTRSRLTILTLLVVSLFIVLFARLWFLQVMAGDSYAQAAEGNTIRTLTLAAPRGQILDRTGEPIVVNRFARSISVQPSEMGDRRDEVMADLADLLGMTPEQVEAEAAANRDGPFRPAPIALDIPEEIEFYIHENRSTRYPGVYLETIPLRDYPHGSLAAHLVGYTGQISAEQLEDADWEGYRSGDIIGWSGVESVYESDLRGIDGRRRLEVDSQSRIVNELSVEDPIPGADVYTTLDLGIQQITEEALAEGIEAARGVQDGGSGAGRGGTFAAPAGAAVVVDSQTGGIVAMASFPTFVPSDFVGGVSTSTWEALSDPENHLPLINRAVQSSYPPGSVYKPITAGMALMEGYLSPDERVACPAEWVWNDFAYPNWRDADAAHMTLAEALEDSCNTVFYELARRMFFDENRESSQEGVIRERLGEASAAWGLGTSLGIDLPSERSGVVPGREWKRDYWSVHSDTYCLKAETLPLGTYAQEVNAELCNEGWRWRGGDAVNMSIGQGDLQISPLQMAAAYGAIANDGVRMRPHVVGQVDSPDGVTRVTEPEVIGELPLDDTALSVIQDGLQRVTSSGTAADTFVGLSGIAGKTGTAEDRPRQPISWFSAYAPADEPRFAVTVMVEAGGGGSQTSAPIARRILEGVLNLPLTEITPGQEAD